MFYTITTSRSAGSLLLLLLGCLQLAFVDVSSAFPATHILSTVDDKGSTGLSTKDSSPCGNLESSCNADQSLRRIPFADHLLEMNPSHELNSPPDTDLAEEVNPGLTPLERGPGYDGGITINQDNPRSMDRPIWNVPFRVVHGARRNLVKFGKRSSSGGFGGYRFKFGKRPRDDDKRMFKFGKRFDGFSDGHRLSAEEDKRMFKFGKRTDDLEDDPNMENGEDKRMFKFGKRRDDLMYDLGTGEEKRMFKFGKRTDDLSGESRLTTEEEKRMFKFGKRFDGFSENSGEDEKRMFKFGKRFDDSLGDLNLENEEEKRKFQFGRRAYDDSQVTPNLSGVGDTGMSRFGEWSKSLPEQSPEESVEEKRMIKFGKKSDGFNDELSKSEAESNGYVQSTEEGKRVFELGQRADPIDEDTTNSEDKRKIMFGKRDKEDPVFVEGLDSTETNAEEEASPGKRRPKFQFGRRLSPRPEDLSAKVRSKFKLGKRSE